MSVRRLSEMAWEQVRDLDRDRTVFVLPVGAIEAHGPHLPLGTDDIIAEAMAHGGGELLIGDGLDAVILPTLSYTSASFASAFAGTISNDPRAVADGVVEIGKSLSRQGFTLMAMANAHLDPVHLGSLRGAADTLAAERPELRVVFPDITRRPWALRLTEEFMSGACHAGRYEGSVVLAARPDLYDRETAAKLPAVPISLVDAMRAGKTSFRAAGGDRAYFGAPAEATAAEGRATIGVLAGILRDAVLETVGSPREDA